MKDYPEKDLTDQIIGAAIEVHKYWGPGLLESVYIKITHCRVGLLLNFNKPTLKEGLKRYVL